VHKLKSKDKHEDYASISDSTTLYAIRLIHLSLRGNLLAEMSGHLGVIYQLLLSLSDCTLNKRDISRLSFRLSSEGLRQLICSSLCWGRLVRSGCCAAFHRWCYL